MSALSFQPQIKVFPCPNCNETINTSMQQCAFCSAPIDAASAQAAADETSRISAAVSDASYLRIAAGVLAVLFFVRFIIGLTGLAYIALSIALPIGCIRWWIKYGAIKTTDLDYAPARKHVLIVSILTGFNLVVWLGLEIAGIYGLRHGGLPT